MTQSAKTVINKQQQQQKKTETHSHKETMKTVSW